MMERKTLLIAAAAAGDVAAVKSLIIPFLPDLLDLMQPPQTPECGSCVIYNRTSLDTGTCSIAGTVSVTDKPVRPDCWFPTDQLRAALYGRGML